MGALAAAIATGISGLVQGALGYRGQQKTNEANMELARFAYRKDMQMWQRNNQYNSPEAQMERLKAAGLNPNLVYGNGAVGNSSGSLPNYQAPRMDYNYTPPLENMTGSVLDTYQNFQIKQAQTDNLRAQNKVIEEEARQKEFMNSLNADTRMALENQRWENLYKTHESWKMTADERARKAQSFPFQLQFQEGQLKRQDAETERISKAMEKMDVDIELQKKVSKWYETKLFTQLGLQALKGVGDVTPWGKGSKTAGQAINQAAKNRREKAFEETTRRMRQFGNN